MNCDNQQHHQPVLDAVDCSSTGCCNASAEEPCGRRSPSPTSCESPIEYSNESAILTQVNSGQLLVVDSHRRNGLILFKRFHAEFAGPGAAVGGFFDIDAQRTVAVGNVALVYPQSHEDRQKAFWTRRHWIRLTEHITEQSVPMQRAQMVLMQFAHYFDRETVAKIPDEALAGLVGVLPQTIRMVRRTCSNPETISIRV